jgi:hypothetical protein
MPKNDIVRKSLSQGLVGFELLDPLHLLPIPPTGIARLRLSAIVFPVLYRLCESPRRSAEIYCCLPCLLSTLLST